jgi:mycofactocin system glycosyltransferase
MAGAAARLRLDRSARRLAGGDVLLAGSPLTWFRLGPAGRQVVDAIERGDPVPSSARSLVDRLLDTGAAHPVLPPPCPIGPDARVTAVVPARHEPPAGLVTVLRLACAQVVVVDDASPVPVRAPGATIIRHDHNRGPGAARNTGLAAVTTPYVAFVDTDTEPTPEALALLVAHLDHDPRVALAAPRVASDPGAAVAGASTLVARYEAVRSPLDLGSEPARISPLTRVSYVPAAALVCRTSALRALGGFDAAQRVGEDVDLLWRLDTAGWRCRYEPAATVRHLPRPDLAGLVRQRMAYGGSAGPLAARHGAYVTPLVASRASGAGWALTAAGHPVAGAATGLAAAVPLARRLPLPGRAARARVAVSLAAQGHARAGLHLASALTRAWWPLALAAALVSRRARRFVAVAALGPALAEWVHRRPQLDPIRYVAVRLIDDASYGAGVWRGAARARTLAPLLPTGPAGARAAPGHAPAESRPRR